MFNDKSASVRGGSRTGCQVSNQQRLPHLAVDPWQGRANRTIDASNRKDIVCAENKSESQAAFCCRPAPADHNNVSEKISSLRKPLAALSSTPLLHLLLSFNYMGKLQMNMTLSPILSYKLHSTWKLQSQSHTQT